VSTVPLLPTSKPDLRPLIVGAPISAGGEGQPWNGDLLWLMGTCVQPVANCMFPQLSAATFNIRVPYRRPPWVQALCIEVELYGSLAAAAGGWAEVNATLTGSAPIGTTDLDGTRKSLPFDDARIVRPLRGIMDVSGVTANTNTTLTIGHAAFTPDAGTLPLRGISRVSVFELPLGSSSPTASADDPGVEGSWPVATGDARNALYDGTATGPAGFKRFVAEMDRARTRPRWSQWIAPQEDSAAWFTDSAVLADLDWRLGDGSTQTVHLYTRAQRLYGSSVADPHEVTVWYKTTSASDDGQLELTAASGTTTNTVTATLPASTTWTSVTGTLDLPADHTEQRVTLTARASIAGGEELRISNICLRAAPP
jgi:hypothetical protein